MRGHLWILPAPVPGGASFMPTSVDDLSASFDHQLALVSPVPLSCVHTIEFGPQVAASQSDTLCALQYAL